jgi:hypothetical protein
MKRYLMCPLVLLTSVVWSGHTVRDLASPNDSAVDERLNADLPIDTSPGALEQYLRLGPVTLPAELLCWSHVC